MRASYIGFLFASALFAGTAGAKPLQAGCVSVEVPAGWTSASEGGVTRLSLSGTPGLSVVIPPSETADDLDDWFARTWGALKGSYKDVQESEIASGELNGHEYRIGGGSMVDESGRELYAMIFGAQAGDRVQPIVMFAQDHKTFSGNVGAYQGLVQSSQFLDEGRWPPPAKKALAEGGWSAIPRTLGPAPQKPAQAQAQAQAEPQSGHSIFDRPAARTFAGTRKDLIGRWRSGSVSPIGFYSPTGGWAPPSGTGQSYEFKSDGTYTYAGLLQSSLYNCTTSIFMWREGKWSESGGAVTVRPAKGQIKSTDNCIKSSNYDRPAKNLEAESMAWHFEQDEYATYLVLVSKSGDLRFVREK